MHRIVEVAADTGTPDAGGFGFQIQHLADQTSFPKQARIQPGTMTCQRGRVFGNHPKTEAAITGDVLETRHLLGGPCDIGVDEGIQLQVRRTAGGSPPMVSIGQGVFERGSL